MDADAAASGPHHRSASRRRSLAEARRLHADWLVQAARGDHDRRGVGLGGAYCGSLRSVSGELRPGNRVRLRTVRNPGHGRCSRRGDAVEAGQDPSPGRNGRDTWRDFDVAKEYAKEKARQFGGVFWEDGVIEEMATGAGTIATELLRDPEPWDMVVVPLGNGSLIKGIAQEMKRRSPDTEIVAVVPEEAPAMAQALLGQQWDESAPVNTLADGLAVRIPIPRIVEELIELIDDVWTVAESDIIPAVKTLMELGAGLCGAIRRHADSGHGRTIRTIFGGSGSPPSSPART